MKAIWHWEISNRTRTQRGIVSAQDARDALSRALTSDAGSGRLVGEAFDVPVDVLIHAPANGDPSFTCDAGGCSMRVWINGSIAPAQSESFQRTFPVDTAAVCWERRDVLFYPCCYCGAPITVAGAYV